MKASIVSVFTLASLAVFIIVMTNSNAQHDLLPLPEATKAASVIDREPYSPARYGIPETLAGFEVVAVVTHAQNPCSKEDFMEVHLRGDSQQLLEAAEILAADHPNVVISFSDSIENQNEDENLDIFFSQLEQRRLLSVQAVQTGRCRPFGGGVGDATPYEDQAQ